MKKLITALLLTSSATTIYAAEPIVTTAAPTAISTPSIVEMQTNVGTITIQLDLTKAPITSKNFVDYVNSGFYQNLLFHRVIKNFMIQGGGVDSTTGQYKVPTFPAIKSEADNGLSNTVGTIAMARTSDPDSATSQFFINTVDNLGLNKGTVLADKSVSAGYTVFGKVIAGMDVTTKIGNSLTYNELPYSNSNSLITIDAVYTSLSQDLLNSITRVQVNGEGKVTSSPTGISCTATATTKCTLSKKFKTAVKLTATPTFGSEFRGWRGDCKGVKTAISLNTNTGNNNCTATFAKIGS
jgi:peptidyl-prolyl cis-trans isomerase A (cyclophilin A)